MGRPIGVPMFSQYFIIIFYETSGNIATEGKMFQDNNSQNFKFIIIIVKSHQTTNYEWNHFIIQADKLGDCN